MKRIRRRHGIGTFSGQLWRRVIGRRRCIEGLIRPRTPLVFARRPAAALVQAPARPIVNNEFRLALAFDFSWPAWIVDARSWPRITRATLAAASLARASRVAVTAASVADARALRAAVPRLQRVVSAPASQAPPPARIRLRASTRPASRTAPVEITHRHVFAPSIPPVAAAAIAPRVPLVIRPAGIAAVRMPPVTECRVIDGKRTVARPEVNAPRAASPEVVRQLTMALGRTLTSVEPATESGHRRTAFEQPVSKVLRQETDAAASPVMPQPSEPRPSPPLPRPAAAAPVIDVERLSDEVYRHIQRRVRIERERRGA